MEMTGGPWQTSNEPPCRSGAKQAPFTLIKLEEKGYSRKGGRLITRTNHKIIMLQTDCSTDMYKHYTSQMLKIPAHNFFIISPMTEIAVPHLLTLLNCI